MTDTKLPALSPGDVAPSYDPAIYGKSLTYEEIADRPGALIFIDNNWWDELADKDADAAVMRVVEENAHTSDVLERAVILPVVEHKISTAITVKDEVKGRSNGDCELIFDAAAERYLLRGLPHDEQLTLI